VSKRGGTRWRLRGSTLLTRKTQNQLGAGLKASKIRWRWGRAHVSEAVCREGIREERLEPINPDTRNGDYAMKKKKKEGKWLKRRSLLEKKSKRKRDTRISK